MIKKYVWLVDVDQDNDEVCISYSSDPTNHDLLCVAEHLLIDVDDDIKTKNNFIKQRKNV